MANADVSGERLVSEVLNSISKPAQHAPAGAGPYGGYAPPPSAAPAGGAYGMNAGGGGFNSRRLPLGAGTCELHLVLVTPQTAGYNRCTNTALWPITTPSAANDTVYPVPLRNRHACSHTRLLQHVRAAYIRWGHAAAVCSCNALHAHGRRRRRRCGRRGLPAKG